MASDPDQPKVPDEEESFRALVQRQIDGPLQESIAQTDLTPHHYLEQAVAKESEIREEVAAQQDAVADLEARVLTRDRRRIATITVFVSVFVLFPLTIFQINSGLPLVLGLGVSIAVALAAGVLVVTFVQELRQSRSATGSTPSSAASSALTLDEQLAAAKDDLRTALEGAVVVWLSLRANEALGEIYDLTLPKLDPTGLAEVDDGEREIATENVADLETTIDLMPGGSIGVSGPRGAGKTTLLKQITEDARRKRPGEIEVAVMVDAPVEYDAREFVLHLFARLCEDALGPLRVEMMRGWRHGLRRRGALPWPFSPLALLLASYPPLLGPLVLAVGLIAYLSLEAAAGSPPDPEQFIPLAALAMALGGTLTFISLVLAIMPRAFAVVFGLPEGSRRSIFEAAERHLRQIWFQQTFTSGWSGSVKLPLGLEGGAEKTSQLAENQLSYPDVVDLYKHFARSLSRRGQVRIGIDELDKMEDEQARRFLNEIKVIFRVSGCFYLVSVSEDAMAYFERRGLPFRDVFDSSFDDMVRVGYLSYKDSRRVLRRRVVGMPIPFIALCHALGGGLARDVIRAARDVCEESPAGKEDEPENGGEAKAIEGPEAPRALGEVTATLCTEELRQKCAAARVTVRRLRDPAQVTLLSRWLSDVDAAATNIPALRSQCRELRQNVVIPLGPSPKSSETALLEHREALSIAFEIAAFAYFTITLRDVMDSIVDQAGVERALDEGVIDGLARARQAFAVNPSEAWLAISAARIGHLKSESIEVPDLSDPQAEGESEAGEEEMDATGQTAGP